MAKKNPYVDYHHIEMRKADRRWEWSIHISSSPGATAVAVGAHRSYLVAALQAQAALLEVGSPDLGEGEYDNLFVPRGIQG